MPLFMEHTSTWAGAGHRPENYCLPGETTYQPTSHVHECIILHNGEGLEGKAKGIVREALICSAGFENRQHI